MMSFTLRRVVISCLDGSSSRKSEDKLCPLRSVHWQHPPQPPLYSSLSLSSCRSLPPLSPLLSLFLLTLKPLLVLSTLRFFPSRAHHRPRAMFWLYRLFLGLLLIDLAAAHVGMLVKFQNFPEQLRWKEYGGTTERVKLQHHVCVCVLSGGGEEEGDWQLAGDSWTCPIFVCFSCCVMSTDSGQFSCPSGRTTDPHLHSV